MVGSATKATPRWTAEDNWHRNAPAVVVLRGIVDNLIERTGNEVSELKFDHRSEALNGCSTRCTGKATLADRRVDYAIFTKLIQEANGYFEGPAKDCNVLAEKNHVLIAPHFVAQCLTDRLKVGNNSHRITSRCKESVCHAVGRRLRLCLGPHHRILDRLDAFIVDRFQFSLVQTTGPGQVLSVQSQRVAFLPKLS